MVVVKVGHLVPSQCTLCVTTDICIPLQPLDSIASSTIELEGKSVMDINQSAASMVM